MKTIKIFVASSEELKAEREMIASLANDLSTKLEKVGIQVIAVEWENLDASMGEPHKQEEYNEKLRECEMCMVLYWTKFGMYTKTELDTAYKEKIAGNNPKKVWVYFKEIGNSTKEPSEELKEFRDSFPTKYGHFYTPFANFDTLKAHFLLQFMEYQSQTLQGKSIVEVRDGKVTIEGKEYVDLQNVPFAGNNEEYNATKKSISDKRNLLQFVPSDNPLYAQTLEELDQLQEKLNKMESSLWDTALMITKLSTSKCSERLQRAMDLFSKGDNKGAQAILNEEEISKDVQHNLNLIKLGEEGKEGLLTNIDEYLLKIQTYENEMEEGWVDKVVSLYEICIDLGNNRIDDSKNAEIVSDYGDFLLTQQLYNKVENIYTEAISLYRKQNQSTDIDYEPCIIHCMINLSMYYIYSNEYQNAEKVLNDILKTQKEDGEDDEKMRYADAIIRLSYLHYNQLQYEKALDECKKAITIYYKYEWYDELCEAIYVRGLINKDLGRPDLAEKDALEIIEYINKFNFDDKDDKYGRAYCLLGNAYNNLRKYSLAIEAHKKALDISEKRSQNNPLPYMQEMAISYLNIGHLHRLTNLYNAAYNDFYKAISILRTLVIQNSIQYSEYYIQSLNSMSNLCWNTKRYNDAEEYINESICYTRKLTETDVERHLFSLAYALNLKGLVLSDHGKYEDAEKAFNEAVEIRKKIIVDFGEQYSNSLALTISNLGLLHSRTKQYEKAEKEFLESTDLYRNTGSVDIYLPLLNLGYLNSCKNNWQKSIDYYSESLDILQKGIDEENIREVIHAIQCISRCHRSIGTAYNKLLQFDHAAESFDSAIKVIEEYINEENQAVLSTDYAAVLNAKAWFLYERGNYSDAEPIATKAVQSPKTATTRDDDMRMCLDTLACIHRELGKYTEAEKEFIECIDISEELYTQNPEFKLSGLYNEFKELSFLYYKVKDIDKFNQYKNKALQYYNKLSEEEKINREEDFKKLESLVIT